MNETDVRFDMFTLIKARRLLIAVDDNEHSRRAVRFVGELLGGLPGFSVHICHIAVLLEDDAFVSEEESREWVKFLVEEKQKMLQGYRNMLAEAGFADDALSTSVVMSKQSTITESIIREQLNSGACIIVVGRRGISKKEEFILGSTTNNLIHKCKNCAVWVVE
ncbi:MAG: universal stress protein [Nitrospirae bacterium]|uniref:universal stress protein n=1 Tax=Candidatus Magnetobacterium casense TaxID=1455061 RepID=UPI00058E3D68|nr:universal stress protein [Candidatus Magnetobacterium casensis]MBF0337316.1 universal stress protein [Nitrospirota bacterium]